MGLKIKSLIAITLAAFVTSSIADESAANAFARTLESDGPKYHNLPLRKTEVLDLNGDGRLEVILEINLLEENAVGFLNSEIYPAFVWIDVYVETGSGFQKATNSFGELLDKRRRFYEKWLQRIKSMDGLGQDSISLIETNNDLFESTLEEYIALTKQGS